MAKNKVKLGSRPNNFKREIEFEMLDGTTACMEVTYIYRTRPEFAALIDGRIAAAIEADPDAATATDHASMADMMKATSEVQVSYVMDVLAGWNLDDVEFTVEAVQQLHDEFPAAVNAIINTYRAAITEGRLGN